MADNQAPAAALSEERLAPLLTVLKGRARAVDEQGLSRALLGEMADAGLLRLLQPKRFGGLEAEWRAAQEAGRLVARVCAASAWVVSVMGAHAALVARMAGEAQDEVWGSSPDALVAAGMLRADARLETTGKGYGLSGCWEHVQGAALADWVLLEVPGGEAGPCWALVPLRDCGLEKISYVGGLRGVGLHRLTVDRLQLPRTRLVSAGELLAPMPPGSAVNDGPLSRPRFAAHYKSAVLGPLLGCAEGAYASYTEITRKRVGGTSKAKVAEFTHVQQRLAETGAELKCAKLLFADIQASLAKSVGNGCHHEMEAELARDEAYVATLCRNAVTRLVRQMGAMGLAEINPVQRQYRDVGALASYPALDTARDFGLYGRQELGLLADEAVTR